MQWKSDGQLSHSEHIKEKRFSIQIHFLKAQKSPKEQCVVAGNTASFRSVKSQSSWSFLSLGRQR
jgi:hypothetical protein